MWRRIGHSFSVGGLLPVGYYEDSILIKYSVEVSISRNKYTVPRFHTQTLILKLVWFVISIWPS